MSSRVVDVRATPVNIPFHAPYRFSYGSIASLTKTVVEVETDDGAVGLGEIASGDQSAAVARLRDRLIGLDVLDLNEAERRCVPAMRSTPWDDVLGARRVFGGIEMALWDARARLAGVSLAQLLGGAVRPEVALTEYFSYRLPGPSHPGESSPLEIARYCAQMIEQHGAGSFEGKVCTVSLDEEIEMVREVRAAIGDGRRLTLDANGGWTVPTAREAIRRLDPFEIFYYEDPVETQEELAQLRGHTGASFSTHVIDLGKTIALGVPDAIVTNLNEAGGIRRTIELIAACARFDVAFRFHSGETGIATAAYLCVSGAIEHVREASQTLVRWYADDVIEGGPFSPRNGVLAVPTGPGLGVTLDREALRRCHERYLREGPFPTGGESSGYGAAFRRR
ncbi:MAG: glucarate dehydratase [Gaiellales bacterium]|nr:glucarate dehydratase [Gaiellales bacterium]